MKQMKEENHLNDSCAPHINECNTTKDPNFDASDSDNENDTESQMLVDPDEDCEDTDSHFWLVRKWNGWPPQTGK